MRVLVIDTALEACTAGLFDDDRALAIRSEPMTRGHQERIGVLVRDVVAEGGGGFQAIDRIGVTVGPGSFTGLRVGLAFAQGLGASLDQPVVGLSTLEALARSADHGSGDVCAVIDARRGQVYFQRFRDGIAVSPAEALDPDAASETLSHAWITIGSGAALLRGADAGGSVIHSPTARALAALTVAADPEAHPARPIYLRAPDATLPTRLPGQARPDRAAP